MLRSAQHDSAISSRHLTPWATFWRRSAALGGPGVFRLTLTRACPTPTLGDGKPTPYKQKRKTFSWLLGAREP